MDPQLVENRKKRPKGKHKRDRKQSPKIEDELTDEMVPVPLPETTGTNGINQENDILMTRIRTQNEIENANLTKEAFRNQRKKKPRGKSITGWDAFLIL